MDHRPLGQTGIDIAPLVLGGNVFGWTADQAASFAVLDAFVDAGLNAIDTADVYSAWVPGHSGGESEAVIGDWLTRNPGKRNQVVVITKVGAELGPDRKGLGRAWIAAAVEDSLRRLRIETIDLYLSHWPDATPHDETLAAYDRLIQAGKVRAVGASNYDAGMMRAALDTAEAEDLPRYQVLQPEYNLYSRSSFDGALCELCIAEGVGVITYFSLASGFLSGKYRSEADLGKSARGGGVAKYLTARGFAILDALDAAAAAHDASPAEVALAWVIAQPGVTAPIASATSAEQVASLAAATRLRLTPEDLAALDAASA